MLCPTSRILFNSSNQTIVKNIINSSHLIAKPLSKSSSTNQIKRSFQLSSFNLAKSSNSQKMALPKVFMEVTANGSPLGRIEMEVSIKLFYSLLNLLDLINLLDLFNLFICLHFCAF